MIFFEFFMALENIEIVMAIEEEFDIEISDDDIPSCKSIKIS